MKQFGVLLCSVVLFFSLTEGVKADTLFVVDFESEGSGYTHIGGFFNSTNDYWVRTNGLNISTEQAYSNKQGSYFFAGEDTDRGGTYSYVSVTTASLSVTNYTDLIVSLLLASGGIGDKYESDDYILLQYSFDGGAFTQLARFSGDSYSSSPLKEDTDFDGLGDGIALSSTFQKFSYIIPGYPGTNLQIRIMANMSASGEEVAFDNIVIKGTPQVPLPSAFILLGSGLVGLVGLRKKFEN